MKEREEELKHLAALIKKNLVEQDGAPPDDLTGTPSSWDDEPGDDWDDPVYHGDLDDVEVIGYDDGPIDIDYIYPDPFDFNDPELDPPGDIYPYNYDYYDGDYPIYADLSCTDYGCMDPEAYNYNTNAGPHPWCNTFCHYTSPIQFHNQDYNEEAYYCTEMAGQIGGNFFPCYVLDGFSYQTAMGGESIMNYTVQCCQLGSQTCSSLHGCQGTIQPHLIDSVDVVVSGPDLEACTPESSGCRNPQYANFSPDHVCDCLGNYIGPMSTGAFAGNQDCCSNDMCMTNPQDMWIGHPEDFCERVDELFCFTSESLVTMGDGTSKKISEIEVGDVVKSEGFSPEGTSKVLQIDKHKGEFEVYSFNGGKAFVTEEHPFKTTEGWKSINPIDSFRLHQVNSNVLQEGDNILTLTEKGSERINSIEKGESVSEVYNLRLDNEHVYYVNGYLVHNGKGDDEGTWEGGLVWGCNDPAAWNYDEYCDHGNCQDDGSCQYRGTEVLQDVPAPDPITPPSDSEEDDGVFNVTIDRVTPDTSFDVTPKPTATPIKTKEPEVSSIMSGDTRSLPITKSVDLEKDKFGKLKEEIKRFNQLIK